MRIVQWILNSAWVLSIILGVAFVVDMVRTFELDQWIAITEFEAWDNGDGRVWVRLKATKKEECSAVIVSKTVRKVVVNGDEQSGSLAVEAIPLAGNLFGKLKKAPLNEEVIIPDLAVPERSLTPGKYVLTLTASCAQDEGKPTGPTLKGALPVQAEVEIGPDEGPR